jgi:UDP-N-acetylglucosamine 2-epimerase (non-hydrolysing)
MPEPDINLKVGSKKQGKQIAEVIVGVEDYLEKNKTDLLIVYGDVNSTLGAAIAGVKSGVKTAHVESGLRSFDQKMPEEINRTIVDTISDVHFITEESGKQNLLKEGVPPESMYFVGNTMIDSLYNTLQILGETSEYNEEYVLVTLHRPSNVDSAVGLRKILNICDSIDKKIVFPLHPRTRSKLNDYNLFQKLESKDNVEIISPAGYIEFVCLMENSHFVITDSGGVQEETTALGTPCLTLRKNTERPCTITHGTNCLVDTKQDILDAIKNIDSVRKRKVKPPLWDGHAAERIAKIIKEEIL